MGNPREGVKEPEKGVDRHSPREREGRDEWGTTLES